MALGTKDGKVVVYRMSTQSAFSFNKLYTTRAGLAYGSITAIDVQTSPAPELNLDGELLIAATETGEIHQFELMKRLNEE